MEQGATVQWHGVSIMRIGRGEAPWSKCDVCYVVICSVIEMRRLLFGYMQYALSRMESFAVLCHFSIYIFLFLYVTQPTYAAVESLKFKNSVKLENP